MKSIKFLTSISLIWPDSVAPQRNQCSTPKLMKQFHSINRPLGVLVSMEERPSLRDVLWDVSWRLPLRWLNRQMEVVPKRRRSTSEMPLRLHWSWPYRPTVIPSFDLSERAGSDVASIEWRYTCCFHKSFVGKQQAYLELICKYYW